jgi:phage protein U
VGSLYQLLKFFDTEFPGMLVHCQLVGSGRTDVLLSGLTFPNNMLALDNLLDCQSLACYKNDTLLQSFIDGVIKHYQQYPLVNVNKLREFFEFNDKLDQSRNVKLADYVPELEAERKRL